MFSAIGFARHISGPRRTSAFLKKRGFLGRERMPRAGTNTGGKTALKDFLFHLGFSHEG
jgi:hypothetical protein